MVDINAWMSEYLWVIDNTFGERVVFVGLQGSYGRGEATESSDIDVVLILDKLATEDITVYDKLLDTLSHRDLICGFLSGKNEIMNWEPSDLFQFYHDTKPIKGSLDTLLSLIDSDAIDRAIKIGICNIYHGCVHNMLHDKNDEILRGLYKSASFVVQAICFKITGRYIESQKELLEVARLSERDIVSTFLHLKTGGDVDFQSMSEMLFNWCKTWINKT